MIAYGKLYIVSTPIGNNNDITLRAIEVLRECDIIVAEEAKPTRALLRAYEIEKPLLFLNEHSTKEIEDEIIAELENGKNIALISDCGTPLVADPGARLVALCIDRGISMTAIPGASSILSALVVCGFPLDKFSFVGFLPREKTERKQAAAALRSRPETLIILEAPYRLSQLLSDLDDGIGGKRECVVCTNLTMPNEKIHRGSIMEVKEHFTASPFKGEFVVILRGNGDRKLTANQHRKH